MRWPLILDATLGCFAARNAHMPLLLEQSRKHFCAINFEVEPPPLPLGLHQAVNNSTLHVDAGIWNLLTCMNFNQIPRDRAKLLINNPEACYETMWLLVIDFLAARYTITKKGMQYNCCLERAHWFYVKIKIQVVWKENKLHNAVRKLISWLDTVKLKPTMHFYEHFFPC